MKRFLPLIFAAGVLLLAGCQTLDTPEGPASDAHGASSEHGSAENGSAEHGSEGHADSSYATASAFPSTTPPSGKQSVTPQGYWESRRVNTDPYVHGGSHGDGGHGTPAQHEAGQSETPGGH